MGSARTWKVFYTGGLFRHRGRDHAGTELPVQARSDWNGARWHIPAVYACARGLVIDYCVEIEPARIRAYLDKWERHARGGRLPDEVRRQIDAENPMRVEFHAQPVLNGVPLRHDHGSGTGWLPESCQMEEHKNRPYDAQLLAHYGLDPARGWVIRRACYHWATARRPKALRSLTLTLAQEPVEFDSARFAAPEPGDRIALTHPVSGERYTLTVHEYQQQQMDPQHFRNDELVYPTHYTAIGYTVTPEPPGGFHLRDTGEGDRPRRRSPEPGRPEAVNSCAIVMLNSCSNEPVTLPDGTAARRRASASELRFDPPDAIAWQAVFCEKTCADLELVLI